MRFYGEADAHAITDFPRVDIHDGDQWHGLAWELAVAVSFFLSLSRTNEAKPE